MYFQPSSEPSWSLPATSTPRFSGSLATVLGVSLREAFPIRDDEGVFADLMNALSRIPGSRVRH